MQAVTGAAGLRLGGQQDPHPAHCRLKGRVTLEACLVASKDTVCLLCGQASPSLCPGELSTKVHRDGRSQPPRARTPHAPAAEPSPAPPGLSPRPAASAELPASQPPSSQCCTSIWGNSCPVLLPETADLPYHLKSFPARRPAHHRSHTSNCLGIYQKPKCSSHCSAVEMSELRIRTTWVTLNTTSENQTQKNIYCETLY